MDVSEHIRLRTEDESYVHASYPHVGKAVVIAFDQHADAVRLHVAGYVDSGYVCIGRT